MCLRQLTESGVGMNQFKLSIAGQKICRKKGARREKKEVYCQPCHEYKVLLQLLNKIVASQLENCHLCLKMHRGKNATVRHVCSHALVHTYVGQMQGIHSVIGYRQLDQNYCSNAGAANLVNKKIIRKCYLSDPNVDFLTVCL